MWLCRFALTTAAVLLAGTAALRLLAWGSGAPAAMPRWTSLAVVSGCVLLLASMLQLGLTSAEMSDLPLAQAFQGKVLAQVLTGTHFGSVWRVRIALIGSVLIAGLIGTAARRTGRFRLVGPSDAATALLTVLVLVSLVAAGHAQASGEHRWLLPTDMIHAAAAGAWPGGLLPLVLLLAQARHQPELLAVALTVTRRFSLLSLVAVGVLAMSGSLNSYALVGTFSGLWTSVYGRLLACKAALFLTMVALGAMNKRLIEKPADDARATISRLWRNVTLECVVAVGVLVVTEVLAMSTPSSAMG